jgi:hypothetical protein
MIFSEEDAMPSSAMQWVKLAVGLLLLLAGLVWALQGINVLGGSSMSGHSQWLIIGAIVAVFGLWIIRGSLRNSPSR